MTSPSSTNANSSVAWGVGCLPLRPPGSSVISTGSRCRWPDIGESAATEAADHELESTVRSAARTTVPEAPRDAAAKNSPSVTPSATAMRSMDAIDGETWPFSTCEMKLGEKSVRSASDRSDKPGRGPQLAARGARRPAA